MHDHSGATTATRPRWRDNGHSKAPSPQAPITLVRLLQEVWLGLPILLPSTTLERADQTPCERRTTHNKRINNKDNGKTRAKVMDNVVTHMADLHP